MSVETEINRISDEMASLRRLVESIPREPASGFATAGFPVGLAGWWTGDVGDLPDGFEEGDGSIKLQATYPLIFALWGTKYNTGGEAGDEFRMVDVRRRPVVGRGSGGFATVGANDGVAEGSRNPDQHLHGLQKISGGAPLTDSANATIVDHGTTQYDALLGANEFIVGSSNVSHSTTGHTHGLSDVETMLNDSDDAPFLVQIYAVRMG